MLAEAAESKFIALLHSFKLGGPTKRYELPASSSGGGSKKGPICEPFAEARQRRQLYCTLLLLLLLMMMFHWRHTQSLEWCLHHTLH